MNIRIAWGTNASMSVMGGKNDKDNKKINDIFQKIMEDNGWIPEVEGASDDVEYFDN